jgi:CBS domain-containing protein
MKAKDIMSRDVVTIGPDASILQAARLMLQNRISGLPVVDSSGTLVGIVTEGDFLRRSETDTVRRRSRWLEFILGPGRLAEEYTHAAGRVAREVMSREVQTVSEDAPLDQVVELMEKHRIKRLPVMRGETLVGIVTRQNLLRAVAGSATPAGASTDTAIRDRLLEEIKSQPWAPIALWPEVADGRVRLIGTIFDDRQRDALRVLAENIPGVKAIEDELVWIEPTSGTVIEPRAA